MVYIQSNKVHMDRSKHSRNYQDKCNYLDFLRHHMQRAAAENLVVCFVY
jgi:UDP-N-acetyl-D-mannosaminuronic acid transferase (WecB/TagA/CpsF family)